MRRQSGFTLLEVLVATVILAAGVVLISQSISRGIWGLALSRQYTTATFLAQQKLAELVAGIISANETRGDFGEEYPSYSWELDFADVGDPMLDLEEVTLTVRWDAGRGERSVVVTTLREPFQEEEGL